MSLQILERPLGIGLSTSVAARIDEDYAGYATVSTTQPHNLAEDDYVYIDSFVEDYNGFWPIHFIDGYHFFLKNPDGTYVAYIVTTDIDYQPESFRHGWSCVHLPITYKLKSNLYPENSVDTSRTVSSFTNDNGYVNLNLSNTLGIFNELQFIKISGASDDDLNGVFQILDKISGSDVTINLAYDSALSFSGASVILFYSSYHVVVKIYAGLNASHRWTSIKPYELAATLQLTPDSNNEVKFSVSEILKSYISIRNNTLLSTLPNNIDFFTQFYISIAESYDQTDGYTITTYEGSFTSDQTNFEGVAANSILEFKNKYSGFLTDHINNKWLTLFETPVAFVGKYFDISLINIYNDSDILLSIKKYLNGNLLATELLTLETPSAGILRLPITTSDNYDQYCIQASLKVYVPLLFSLVNISVPLGGNNWALGSSPNVVLNAGVISISSVTAAGFYNFIVGDNYTITYEINSSVSWNLSGISLRVFDISDNVLDSHAYVVLSGSGTISRDHTFVAPSGSVKFGISVSRQNSSSISTSNYTLVSITITNNSGGTQAISEELCIDINSECSNQEIYLTWLNNLGGFDYWNFTAYKDPIKSIGETTQVKKNIFPSWPKSYGEKAQSITKQTSRQSTNQILVRSQNVTLEQLQAIEYIKSSIDVYIMNSRSDLRSVIVDSDSFTSYQEENKLYNISFTITYTDEIPSQRA